MKLVFKILVFMFLVCNISFGQVRSLTGIVRDVSGETMPGVSVIVKGTSVGTVTLGNGEFQLSASSTDTLQFVFIGKRTESELVGDRNVFNITMFDDDMMIEEVVVQAFGRTRRRDVVSSITTVNVNELRVPASNFTTALAGNVAGLISYQTTGEPGADNAAFFIRGVTSFGYARGPLILIDGFESSADDLARLQVDDIESFSVLKDASAAVMYGARSANGIISIVTKGGREGPIRIGVRIDSNVSWPTQRIEFLDGVEYMRLFNEAQMTRNPQLGAYYSEQKIQMTAQGVHPMIYPNVQWYDEMFNKATYNTRGSINISGGGQVANYYVAGGMERETGLLKVDRRNNFNNNINIVRTNLRTNVMFKLHRTTTLDTRITARFERYTGPYESTSYLFHGIMLSNPVDFPPFYEPDEQNEDTTWVLFGSKPFAQGWKVNPYAQMVRGYEDRNNTSIVAMATLNHDFDYLIPNLSLSLKASADTHSRYSSRRNFLPFFYAMRSYDHTTGDYELFPINLYQGQFYLGDVDPDRDAASKYYFEGILRWHQDLGLHHIGAQLVGAATENLYGGGSTNMFETLPEKNMVLAGRATYNFDRRYYLDFSFGYNGSEKFTGEKRFGFFPAIAAGWTVSNESFFEPLSDVVSLLRLRGSWGKGGNDAIGRRQDRFRFLSHISLPNNENPLGDGGHGYRWGTTFMNSFGGYNVQRYANPEISWEASTKYNAGVELNLFRQESVRIMFDMFQESRESIYWVRENFPATSGLEAEISGNVGKVNSRGFDGSIDVQHFFGQSFWVQGRFNFTYARNEIIEIDERNFPDHYLRRKGHPIDQQWGLIGERLFVDDAEIANSPRQDWGEYMAGDIKYKDVNDDGVVNSNDRVAMGYPTTPEVQYGFGMSMGYGRFDFSFFLQGNARVSIFIDPTGNANPDDERAQGIAPFIGYRNALPVVARDYWSETAPNPHAFWPRLSTEPIDNNIQQSSWWMRNGSFMRLKNIEIGYNIPYWESVRMQNLRIYVTGENLLVFSRFKLWDPEMGARGLRYPPNRRINVGIHMNF